jgi:hypothetical protein
LSFKEPAEPTNSVILLSPYDACRRSGLFPGDSAKIEDNPFSIAHAQLSAFTIDAYAGLAGALEILLT